jgi:flagellar M-ring protein FliF
MADLALTRSLPKPSPTLTVDTWLDRSKPLLLLIGVALAVAAGVTVVLWSRPAAQTALFTQLNDRDAAAVVDSLRGAGFAVQIGPGPGVIQVPAFSANDARMHLARSGVTPQGTGMDMLGEPQGFGVSSFMEGARYQHALEQELARTISALQPVANARVHLAMPKQSAFIRDRARVTASVVLDLLPGARLDQGQAEAIAHLVAASIPELQTEDVTVVDARGAVLSQLNTEGAAMERHFELARRMESMLVARVQQLIAPLVGRAEVQVMVELDPTEAEQASEVVDPNPVMREEQITRETGSGAGTAAAPAGVPGAAANQPPEAGGMAPDPAAAAESVTTAERRSFDVSREVHYTRTRGNRVERVTVAVLLDRPPPTAPVEEGTPPATPAWSAETLADVEALVRDAVGFSEARGDRVTVRQGAMQAAPVIEPPLPAPWWQAAWVYRSAREGLGVLALALIAWLLIRPLLKNLSAPRAAEGPPAMALPGDAADGGETPPRNAALTALDRPGLSLDDKLLLARQAVNEDAKRVAQVVKSWVGTDA